MSNRLAESSSAYLRSAAHQPIDWHEFGDEAFEKARKQDKPILLDIGAVWCHWCHVIDRESYENGEIAALINQHYIPVKVDRDQRPDVDARYQQVVSSMTGQGGWPLTAFLTHDGRLIYGGTYFPPDTMKNLLGRIQQVYEERKQEIFARNETLDADRIREMEQAERSSKYKVQEESLTNICPMAETLGQMIEESAKRAFDPVHGGFGSAPKFPHFSTLEYLIAAEHRSPNTDRLRMIEKTLTGMATGGIYDQIMGGFHRYSVDDRWHVPHFEKMAYDNAEALKVYAQAYRLTGNPFYLAVAEGIVSWVSEWLSDQENGGFYSSQDADIDLTDDGDHFTWSPEELREILTPQEERVVSLYYDIHSEGDMHHAKGRNVLYIAREPQKIADETGMSKPEVESLLHSSILKMQERRRQRPIPYIDKTLYANWNGMMLSAWFEAADLLEREDMRAFAKKSVDRILTDLYKQQKGLKHAFDVEGFLEDQAWMTLACLKAYYSTGDSTYATIAHDIGNQIVEHFEDPELGGYFDTRESNGSLALLNFRRKPVEDNPSSSANAIVLQCLIQRAYLTRDERDLKRVEKALALLIHDHGQYGLFVSALGVAAQSYLHPPLKLELIGDSPELAHAMKQLFYPGKVLIFEPLQGVEQPEVRICIGTQCLPPVRTGEDLVDAVRNFTERVTA